MKIGKFLILAILSANLFVNIFSMQMSSNYRLRELLLKKDPNTATQGVTYDEKGNAKKDELKKLSQEELNKDDLPDIPIYFQGWIKYFKFNDEVNAKKPKNFFKNTDFGKQSEVKTDSDKVYML